MSVYAFTAPIVPGKVEEWQAFTRELSGAKKSEYVASRKRAGITRESAFHQKTPMGDFVIVVVESASDPDKAIKRALTSNDPFDRWFAERVKQLHGLSVDEIAKMPANPLGLDWHA